MPEGSKKEDKKCQHFPPLNINKYTNDGKVILIVWHHKNNGPHTPFRDPFGCHLRAGSMMKRESSWETRSGKERGRNRRTTLMRHRAQTLKCLSHGS